MSRHRTHPERGSQPGVVGLQFTPGINPVGASTNIEPRLHRNRPVLIGPGRRVSVRPQSLLGRVTKRLREPPLEFALPCWSCDRKVEHRVGILVNENILPVRPVWVAKHVLLCDNGYGNVRCSPRTAKIAQLASVKRHRIRVLLHESTKFWEIGQHVSLRGTATRVPRRPRLREDRGARAASRSSVSLREPARHPAPAPTKRRNSPPHPRTSRRKSSSQDQGAGLRGDFGCQAGASGSPP